jgi:hypothetical protein
LLALSEEALEVCIGFHDNIEAELGPGGWAADVSGFAAKGPEHACRIAAIMTLFEDPRQDTISADIMHDACQIINYHLAQYKYLCIAATNETEVAKAQGLLDWLRKNLKPGDAFATDKVLQFGPAHARQARALDRLLNILMEYGWVHQLPSGTEIEGKKRRKAFRLSPKA